MLTPAQLKQIELKRLEGDTYSSDDVDKVLASVIANYEEVLMQMMNQVAAGLTAREDRKNVLFEMKLTLAVISVVAVVIVMIIGTGLGIDVVGCLTGNVFGQILLFITGILYLMVGIKMFGTDKIGG